MIVKVGDQLFDSQDQPVFIAFTSQEELDLAQDYLSEGRRNFVAAHPDFIMARKGALVKALDVFKADIEALG